MRQYWVYILSSRSRQLYIGVTGDLRLRLSQHRLGEVGYTARYRIHRLVYFESTTDVRVAIERETQLKTWKREKKVALIQTTNPDWEDLGVNLGLVDVPYPQRSADSSLRSE